MSFSNFVNRVLLQHSLRNSRSIHKFYLANNYSKFDVYDVESWVITMILRGVQEIEIELKVYDPYCQLFILPPSVFISKTLVVLNLSGFIIMFDVPSSVCIPNLKTLYLKSVTYQNDESLRNLISTSLVLESLTLIRKRFDNVGKVCIFAPALKRLKIDFFLCNELFQNFESTLVLEINAPALQYLDIRDHDSKLLLVTKCDNSIVAHVDVENGVWGNPKDDLIKFFEAISNVKFLSVNAEALDPVPELSSRNFLNLTHLHMLIRCVWHPLLPYFLEGANNLEVLTLGQGDDDLDFNASTEPEHVPRCLSSCLRSISVENFCSQETEFEMLKFFLKNGKVLKTLEIASPRQIDKREKDSILEKISEFPRASETCEITVR